MAGYQIIEESKTILARKDGYRVSENRMGILDFVREIKEDPFPFNFGDEVTVEGLDKLLHQAGKDVEEVAAKIRSKLTVNASTIDRERLTTYIVLAGKLKYGVNLIVEYARRDLPIYLIFNRVSRHQDSKGNVFYTTNANLSG